MPDLNGIEATRRIVATADAPRVLVLTTFDHDRYVFDALAAGASGFLLFVDGRLETMDCPFNLPVASCGPATVIRKLWAWNGRDFSRI
jgi:CheY-like chemotaxis protein